MSRAYGSQAVVLLRYRLGYGPAEVAALRDLPAPRALQSRRCTRRGSVSVREDGPPTRRTSGGALRVILVPDWGYTLATGLGGSMESGGGWKSPSGITAISGVSATVVAALALFVGSHTGGGGADSKSTAQTAPPSTTVSFHDVSSVGELTAIVDQVAEQSGLPAGSTGAFVELSSPGGDLSSEVPTSWGDQEVTNWITGKDTPIGLALVAATDMSRFLNAWSSPGVFVGVGTSKKAKDLSASALDDHEAFYESSCVKEGEGQVLSGSTTGRYRVWSHCGSSDSLTVEYARPGGRTSVSAAARLVSRSDVTGLDRVLRRLEVRPPFRAITSSQTSDDLPGYLIP